MCNKEIGKLHKSSVLLRLVNFCQNCENTDSGFSLNL